MKKFLVVISFLVCTIIFPELSKAQAQQDSIKYRVETKDGNEFFGIILERTSEKVRIKTDKLGELSINTAEIKSISEVKQTQAKDGTYWLDNPQSTRYFWSPNGYSLKKGEGYYQNVWIMGNQAVYGFTNHLSGGIGVIPTFLFGGAPTPAWLTLKYSVPVVKEKFNVSAGALVGTVIGESTGAFGILYGMSTFGNKDKNLNIGAGWAFGGGQIAKIPTFNISGMIRTGPKGYFITENYLIGTTDTFLALISFGGRRIIKHTGLDFGGFIPIGSDVGMFIIIPWLGFTVPF
jgi:hypothetical protein